MLIDRISNTTRIYILLYFITLLFFDFWLKTNPKQYGYQINLTNGIIYLMKGKKVSFRMIPFL